MIYYIQFILKLNPSVQESRPITYIFWIYTSFSSFFNVTGVHSIHGL